MNNLKKCSILKEGNTHYSDSSKPLDKLFDDMDDVKDKFFKDIDKALPKEVTYISRLEQEVKQLKNIAKGYRFEIATLKTSLSKAGELIEELKQENFSIKTELEEVEDLLTPEQMFILKRQREDLSKEINREVNEEKGKEIE